MSLFFAIREPHTANVVGLFDNSVRGGMRKGGTGGLKEKSVKCIIRLIESIVPIVSIYIFRFVLMMSMCYASILNFVIVF